MHQSSPHYCSSNIKDGDAIDVDDVGAMLGFMTESEVVAFRVVDARVLTISIITRKTMEDEER